jgi:hypothetical protein
MLATLDRDLPPPRKERCQQIILNKVHKITNYKLLKSNQNILLHKILSKIFIFSGIFKWEFKLGFFKEVFLQVYIISILMLPYAVTL